MSENEAEIAEMIYNVVEGDKSKENIEKHGYTFRDLDNNGTPELIIMYRYLSVRAIITISDNEPVLVEQNFSKGSSFKFADRNKFFVSKETEKGENKEVTQGTCHVSGAEMVYDSLYGFEYSGLEVIEYFQIKNGARTVIDKETYDELYREQKKER